MAHAPGAGGLRAGLPQGEVRVQTTGPFPLAELERQQRIIEDSLGPTTWHSAASGDATTVTGVYRVEGIDFRPTFFVRGEAFVFVTLETEGEFSDEELRAVESLLASIRIHRIRLPSEMSPCSDAVLDNVENGSGGACLEPAVLGAEAVRLCGEYLRGLGLQRSATVEKALGERTGKVLECWGPPDAPLD